MMYNIFYLIAKRFDPELESMSEQRQMHGVGEVISSLLALPLVIWGLAWLILETEFTLVIGNWGVFILFGGLIFLFQVLKYFVVVEIRTNQFGSAEGSLTSTIHWAAVFLFGQVAIWLAIIESVVRYIWQWRHVPTTRSRWNLIRNQIFELATYTLPYLVALRVYENWGGEYPISGLTLNNLLIALGTLLINFLLGFLIWSIYLAYGIWSQRSLDQSFPMLPTLKFLLQAFGLPMLAHPYSILISGLFVEHGISMLLFVLTGFLIVGYLIRRFSWIVETDRQHSRQLEKLENLGRGIINSRPDSFVLPSLLEEHVPVMFPSARIAIWILPDEYLVLHPDDWNVDFLPIWQWVKTQALVNAFLENDELPWSDGSEHHDAIICSPIFDIDNSNPIGCIYIELQSIAQSWDRLALKGLYSAVNTLAAQIASALHQVTVYDEILDYQTTLQELKVAGKIQSSFLPNEFPELFGWELAVTLLPARETSGDFFDFVPLGDGKVGILIADVTDKGMGAALYMALSRTLIRTYALEYDSQPEIVFFSANERILQDARANLFVTAFYGVLDQHSGELIYANAGHNPPLLISPDDGGEVRALMATGMPLGIDEDASWTQSSIKIKPGQTLILYTDGIPDAQNGEGEFFKERQLIEVIQQSNVYSAQDLQTSILEEVQAFVGTNPQFDDITLLILRRDRGQPYEQSNELSD